MEWILVLVVFLPAASWLVGVWFSAEAEHKAFRSQLDVYDAPTPDHRNTPRVRMTLYRKLIDKTRERTQRILAPEVKALQDRRRVFLRFRSIAPEDEAKTLRIPR